MTLLAAPLSRKPSVFDGKPKRKRAPELPDVVTSSEAIVFRIPTPPSVNNLYANVRGRGRIKSERYRVWRNAAAWAMRLDGNKPRSWETISGPVSVEIICGGRADVDNRSKAALDLLVEMKVIGDDRQVAELRVKRGENPREATVTVRPL